MKTLVDLLHSNKQYTEVGFNFIQSREKDEFVSYHDFFEKAVSMAYVLKQKGFQVDDELILAVDDMQGFLTIFWACILEGIRAIPCKLSEDTLEQIQSIWTICKNPKIITDVLNPSSYWDTLTGENMIQYSEITLEDGIEYQPTYCPNEDDVAYIQFSSGSSSNAKGVEITHKMTISWQKLLESTMTWAPQSGLSWVPLYHNYGLVAGSMLPLYFHVSANFISTEEFFRDPILWGICIDRYKPSHLETTNYALNYFLKKLELEENEYDWDFSSIKDMYVGAEPISPSLCKEFKAKMERFGLRDNTFSPGYGLAEAVLTVAMTPDGEEIHVKNVDTGSLDIGGHIVEVDENEPNHSTFMATGKRNHVTQLKIFDLNENELGDNQVGLICIKGDCVFKRYYRNNHNNSFLSNGWLNTGDLGFVDHDFLYVTGRYKNMFLYNGKNYYSNDIEEYIANQNDMFRDMLYIVGYRKDHKDVNDTVLCFLAYKDDLEERVVALQEVIEKVHSDLGVYISDVIPVNTVPKTVSGKVKRYSLKENYEDGLYEKEIAAYLEIIAEQAVTDEDEIEDVEMFLEDALVSILGDNFDIGANFIEMGLQSKDISKFYIKIDQHFPNLITISDLFEFQNVEQLAEYIKEKNTK